MDEEQAGLFPIHVKMHGMPSGNSDTSLSQKEKGEVSHQAHVVLQVQESNETSGEFRRTKDFLIKNEEFKMVDRKGRNNAERFPYRESEDGFPLCRMCGNKLPNKRRTFCGPRCVRDFKMQTDWQRVRRVVYERDGGICMKCGKPVSRDNFHVDHIIPISAGGDEWDLNNLELSCPECNLRKGSKIYKYESPELLKGDEKHDTVD